MNSQIAKFVNRVANEIMVKSKECAPWDSGNLSGDIRVLKKATPSTPSAIIGNTKEAPYASFVHFGTKPFTIKPKKKKALKTKFGVFKKVNHPGLKANPFYTKSLDKYTASAEFANTKKAFLDNAKQNIKTTILKDFNAK